MSLTVRRKSRASIVLRWRITNGIVPRFWRIPVRATRRPGAGWNLYGVSGRPPLRFQRTYRRPGGQGDQ
jgi:hypothetical protein